ncbi:MAG TPA: hypothetical protein VFK89_07500 [Actinomycetota bacterium]|nr:hypothetical protein [Actinomycetota bacterium]
MFKRARLLVLALVLASIAAACSGGGGSDSIKVSITDPKDGATVAAGESVPVQADIEGADLATSMTDTSAGHIHIYVDGKIASMPIGDSATVKLKPGDHEIEVEYVDADHKSLDPPVIATVHVTAK